MPRLYFLNPDFSRGPVSNHSCCVCQATLTPGTGHSIWVDRDGLNAVHPEDANGANSVPGVIGPACVDRLPQEFLRDD